MVPYLLKTLAFCLNSLAVLAPANRFRNGSGNRPRMGMPNQEQE